MSENEIKRDLSRYDTLTTEELEQILLADMLITDEDEEYLEMIVYVAEVYAQRKKKERIEPITIHEPAFLCDTQQQPKMKQKPVRRFLRSLAAVAAVVALVFCGTMAARSMGYDLWGAMTEWTSSVFQFKAPETPQLSVDPLKAIERMKPSWLPEGFELVEERISPDSHIRYHALYKKGNASITLTFQEAPPNNTHYLEKSEDKVEIYEKNGLSFHIFKNMERTVTVWYVKGLTCHIGGDISVNEMKKIIDSIGQS